MLTEIPPRIFEPIHSLGRDVLGLCWVLGARTVHSWASTLAGEPDKIRISDYSPERYMLIFM